MGTGLWADIFTEAVPPQVCKARELLSKILSLAVERWAGASISDIDEARAESMVSTELRPLLTHLQVSAVLTTTILPVLIPGRNAPWATLRGRSLLKLAFTLADDCTAARIWRAA